jgi:hypothetical protein
LQIKTIATIITIWNGHNLKTSTTSNVGEDVEQQELSFIDGGNAKQ